MSVPFPMPPLDQVRSARTGWTRAHWESLADGMLASLRPYASPHGGLIRLPGRPSLAGPHSDGLEGFARSFLLAAFRLAGTPNNQLATWYADGLAAGTDPDGPEAWPRSWDFGQPLVEAASIAVALHESRALIWDRLDSGVQARVIDWLTEAAGRRPHPNNWTLFPVVVHAFLASVGEPLDAEAMERTLTRLECWHAGDGWYSDGDGRAFDYYGGWAIHLYPLLTARILGWPPDREPVRTWRHRLAAYLDGYQHLVAPNGAPLHQGRSLTYRWAMLAPIWLGALCDATPLPPGRTRRLASGVVGYFLEHGALNPSGVLTRGWHGEHLPATQPYSGPASPYWASKGFLGLLLPADHPVWTAPEEPLESELHDVTRTLHGPGWLVQASDGMVRVANHGSEWSPIDDPHYGRLAYSTHTAPQTAGIADNALVLATEDGTRFERIAIRPVREGASRFTTVLPGLAPITVEITSTFAGRTERRTARIPPCPGVTARASGFAVAGPTEPTGHLDDGSAEVGSAELASTVRDVAGFTGAGIDRTQGANAFGEHSATPYLTAAVDPETETVLSWTVELRQTPPIELDLGVPP